MTVHRPRGGEPHPIDVKLPGPPAPMPSRREAIGLLGGAAVLGMVGCAPVREDQAVNVPPVPVWPSPPAAARYSYVTTLRTNLDVRRRDAGAGLKALVTGREPVVRLLKPYAVAASAGIVYVSDTVARRVHAFDLPRGRFFGFGLRREGKLSKPLGLSVDAQGRVYVADVTARRVVIFDHLGLFLGAVGGKDLLRRPTDVAVTADGSRIYIVDLGGVETDRHQVVAFDTSGKLLYRITGRGKRRGQLNLPVAAAVATDGTLYVLDAGNFRVQAFDSTGRFLRAWGGVGRGYGQFARPKSIAVDDQGRVYVADAAFGNAQIFNAQGQLLLPVGSVGRVDSPGRYGLLTGVAADAYGFVYLLDQLFAKVDVLRAVGAGSASPG